MRAGNLRRRRVDLRPEPDQQARDRAPFLVDRFEDARRDDAATVDDERAGERIPVELVLRVDRRVEDAVALDRVRARVGQQRKRDATSRREIGQRGHRVIADRGQAHAGLANLGKTALQLHELRFAVRSPVGRAEEDDDGALRTEQRLQRLDLPLLIAAG